MFGMERARYQVAVQALLSSMIGKAKRTNVDALVRAREGKKPWRNSL